LLLRVSVPAKINLWLEVLRKRDDGYHELSSLMLPVGVCDFIELESHNRRGISLECDNPMVPSDESNLAWRAAELFLSTVGTGSGVHIRLAKRIPAAAGLGGGSADAAAVLLGLNRLHRSSLAMPLLESLGEKLGADVPFFLHQRPALATGTGVRLSPVEGLPDYPLLLIKPPLSISTRRVYQSLKLTRGESRISIVRFIACPWRVREVMENDLETVSMAEYSILGQIKEWLLQNGAAGALMSGSGPTVFGVFHEMDEVLLLEPQAKRRWPECWVAATQVRAGAAVKTE
jgi:4-diphosphocytidyl-2-C-methyl-D-erythritol kinase